MGADDGGNKPHPATKNPQDLFDNEGPGRPLLHRQRRPIVDTARTQQVTEPAGYAVAGKVLLASAGALAGVLLALIAMYLYNSIRRRRLAAAGGGRRRLDRSLAIVGGEDRDDGTDATPRGLDPAVLRALPVVVVAAVARDTAGDCAVCLAELQPGDKARALPQCAHLFHADCIDAWFRGNATCPLCRADVVLAPTDGDDNEDAVPKVHVHVVVDEIKDSTVAPPAMGRLPSGTDLDKTRRAFFASTRSVSF